MEQQARYNTGKRLLKYIHECGDMAHPRRAGGVLYNWWEWDDISANPNITMELINENPDLYWEETGIARNPNITMEFVRGLDMELTGFEDVTEEARKNEFWLQLSINPSVTIETVLLNLDLKWDFEWLVMNPNITQEIIQSNPDLPWKDVEVGLLYNESTPLEYVMEYVTNGNGKHWTLEERYSWFSTLSHNKHITIDFIKSHDDLEWNWDTLTMHPNITPEMIEETPELPWEYDCLGGNPNVTLEYIENNADIPWDWTYTVINPHITIQYLKETPFLPISYARLSANSFQREYELELERLQTEHAREEHKTHMSTLATELTELLFNPDNMKFAKKLGVYDDIVWSL